jgi:hypothetical protein
MNADEKKITGSVTRHLVEQLNIGISDIEIADIGHGISKSIVCLAPHHPGIPSLIVVKHEKGADAERITPYYRVNERPDRQILSYLIGKDLSNLAEIKEIDGRLYSRACLSYDPAALIHRNPVQSRMGLWVHDCLTEDLDHHKTLNRHVLPEGACVSFDFGLAFSCRYYPPFYTAELGIEDEEIMAHQSFLIQLLSGYARRLAVTEQEMMAAVEKNYPKTHHMSLCRYYYKNFISMFPVRLRYGRFFEKIKRSPFNPEKLGFISDAIGLKINGISGWEVFMDKLAGTRPVPMDLRGLDLSGVDLRNAYFRESDLRRADFSGSNVAGADFRGADLRGACLEGANMDKAMTEGVNLG